jgi:hypothetical protein
MAPRWVEPWPKGGAAGSGAGRWTKETFSSQSERKAVMSGVDLQALSNNFAAALAVALAPPTNAVNVDLSQGDFATPNCRRIYAAGAGVLTIESASGVCSITVAANSTIEIKATKVRKNSTTATGLVVLW